MRKRIVTLDQEPGPEDEADWLDLETLAEAELTSEDPAFPIEEALGPAPGRGWRAASPGRQILRLRFDPPRDLRRLRLEFEETERGRTQEIVLRWSPDLHGPSREILRQQWNFAPPGTTREVEDYRLALDAARLLELEIVPDIAGGDARASLSRLRVA